MEMEADTSSGGRAGKRGSNSIGGGPSSKNARAAASGGNGGAGGGGGDTTVIQAAIERPIRQSTAFFHFKRRLRYFFNNAQLSSGWLGATESFPYTYSLDGFYEIPHNHIGWFINPHEDGIVNNFNGYKVNFAKWGITSIEALTIREVNPTATEITYEPASNITPSFQIWHHEQLPPFRNRYWDIRRNGAIDVETDDPDCSSTRVAMNAVEAEARESNLPQVIMGVTPRPQSGPDGRPAFIPAGSPWLINKYAETLMPGGPGYSCECEVDGQWRRLRGAMRSPLTQSTTVDSTHHRWDMDYRCPSWAVTINDTNVQMNYAPPQQDFLGRDKQQNGFYYRSGATSEDMTVRQTPNLPVFIRFTPTSANMLGSETSQILEPILMKAYIDIETEIGIEASYESIFPGQGITGGRINENQWSYRNSLTYYEGCTEMVGPGKKAQKKYMDKQPINEIREKYTVVRD